MVMDREAWHAVIHGVAKSRAQLSDWTELNNPPFCPVDFFFQPESQKIRQNDQVQYDHQCKKKKKIHSAKYNEMWFFLSTSKEISCKFLILYHYSDDLWRDILFWFLLNKYEQIWILPLRARDTSQESLLSDHGVRPQGWGWNHHNL